MKIGVIGTIWLDIPPKGYGGTEEVIYNLVNGLVDKGHEVSLFGSAKTKTNAKLIPTVNVPLRDKNVPWENVTYTLYHLTQALDREGEFDVIHMHLNKAQDYIALPLAISSKTPIIFTIHFRIPSLIYKPDRFAALQKYRFMPFVSISDSQRKGNDLSYIKTVYNGINLANYPFNSTPGDYFVWLGKIKHDKGTKEAILAAKQAGVKLYVLGAIDRGVPADLNYFENEVKPLIDNKQIIFKENVTLPEKAELLGKAKAMLNPINWEEPFGLVMAEAQATGTPVIAFKRGAASELIIEDKTGFLVYDIPEMVLKMKEVKNLNRADCRKNVEDRFSINAMVKGYEEAYLEIMRTWDNYIYNQKQSNKANKEIAEVNI